MFICSPPQPPPLRGAPLVVASRSSSSTPSPPIKSLDFEGFDSSRLLIIRGGNSHVRLIL